MTSTATSLASTPGVEPLMQRYERTRAATLALAQPLAAEDQVVQTIPEVSPTKWHLAHITWFFEQFCLRAFGSGYEPCDARYHYLFNSYYYTAGNMFKRAHRGLLSRPTVAQIHAYRHHVDDAMLALIDRRSGDPAFDFVVELGLNHEQQHQELLLADIKHVFFSNPLGPVYTPSSAMPGSDSTPLRFHSHSGGLVAIGTSGCGLAGNGNGNGTDDNGNGERGRFCFDNETPRHETLLRPHAIANRLVTNREFREFIDAGGYADPALWLSDGWSILNEEGWSRPLYWSEDLAQAFTLGGWRDIDPHAPVCHVSYYEADAFARWSGARLPSEAEWECAAIDAPIKGNLLDSRRLHPAAATSDGDHPTQLFGDVWEWTASPYGPYPGFKPLAGSLGEYNGKFMCNQMVVRGGSCLTWREHIRPTYRSFFYPKDRWQMLGFRLARDL